MQPNGGLGESNAGLVVGDGEALLVDTLWDERLTAAMLAAMEPVLERSGAPIGQLFNTHGDGDHWYGNGLLGAGVEMIASSPAVEQMRAEPPSLADPDVAGRDRVGPARQGAAPPRGGSDAGARRRSGAMLGAYEFDGIHPRVPDRSFTTRRRSSRSAGGRSS